ncbi:PRTRC system protein C [Deinococcus soli (ex Cha et al. 2016)]|uniref:PRTRC system protein C n=1 Tax=Deinococcus soli (ex Cha et al. 2016) TaxID=1309411 RepID=UPI00166A8C03|nr:PRTRC system protein C [Deinococcus soli (ex Cha et al. 2016)]GGB70838.1 hypothetical protein GCM10008019_28750 [Deinococcus soli (ex Cha et al. 2016)]
MSTKIQPVVRVILFEGKKLADLNPQAPVEDVVRLHAVTTPALATAVVEGPVITDGQKTYTVQKRAANKG